MPLTTLTVEEAAVVLKLSPITVYRQLVKRRLPGFKVGNQWRIREDLLGDWMEEKSGWTRRFDRLWLEFRKRGAKKHISEADIVKEIQAVRRG